MLFICKKHSDVADEVDFGFAAGEPTSLVMVPIGASKAIQILEGIVQAVKEQLEEQKTQSPFSRRKCSKVAVQIDVIQG